MTEGATEATDQDAATGVLSQAIGDAMRDQRLRQTRLRHVQEFLSSPAFLDLRDSAIIVSDDARALADHRHALTYQIEVLQSVLALLTEERALLDRVTGQDGPESGSDPESEAESKPQPDSWA